MPKTIAITGASGYVGGLLQRHLTTHGHRVLVLGRQPHDGAPFWLGGPHPDAGWFREHGVDVLLHGAWDFSDRTPGFVQQRNVAGSLGVLRAAVSGGAQVIHLSSMSAWDGSPSVYGRAKRSLELRVTEMNGINLRLGLVWAPDAGGMAGALRKLARLPVVLVPSVPAPLYLIEPEPLVAGVLATLGSPNGTYTLCRPNPVSLVDLMRSLAPNRPVFPVSWQLPWLFLKVAEAMGLHLRSHSDSLLSLSCSNPHLMLGHAAQITA